MLIKWQDKLYVDRVWFPTTGSVVSFELWESWCELCDVKKKQLWNMRSIYFISLEAVVKHISVYKLKAKL